MGVACLAGDGDDRRLQANAFGDQMVVDRTDCQQHRHRGMGGIDLTVAEHDDRRAEPDRLGGFCPDLLEPPAHALGTFRGLPHRRDPVAEEPGITGADDRLEIRIGQDRRAEFDEVGLLGGLGQEGSAPTEIGPQRHDPVLANRVHRRIRDLGEHLLEVLAEPPGALVEGGELGIRPHGSDRSLALRHLRQDHPPFLGGVPEGPAQGV